MRFSSLKLSFFLLLFISSVSIAGPTLTVQVTDNCIDGKGVGLRFFGFNDLDDDEPALVWPADQTQAFVLKKERTKYKVNLNCGDHSGLPICYGGQSGRSTWGLGLNGDLGCQNCCLASCETKTWKVNLTCGTSVPIPDGNVTPPVAF